RPISAVAFRSRRQAPATVREDREVLPRQFPREHLASARWSARLDMVGPERYSIHTVTLISLSVLWFQDGKIRIGPSVVSAYSKASTSTSMCDWLAGLIFDSTTRASAVSGRSLHRSCRYAISSLTLTWIPPPACTAPIAIGLRSCRRMGSSHRPRRDRERRPVSCQLAQSESVVRLPGSRFQRLHQLRTNTRLRKQNRAFNQDHFDPTPVDRFAMQLDHVRRHVDLGLDDLAVGIQLQVNPVVAV